MNTKYHMCQSVRGALRNWNKRMLSKIFVHEYTGKPMSADEVKDVLLDELSKGHEVLPFGKPCEGFSYKTGCPGHPVEPKAGSSEGKQ